MSDVAVTDFDEAIGFMSHVRGDCAAAVSDHVGPGVGTSTVVGHRGPHRVHLATALPPAADAPGIDHGHLRAAFVQLATGVTALHCAGKLHLDLKPSHAMVRKDGRVVLVDFGLVVEIDAYGAPRWSADHRWPDRREHLLHGAGAGRREAAVRGQRLVRGGRHAVLFIHELVQHVDAGSSATSTEGTSLDDVLWRWVCRLPDDTRLLLEVIAVAGQPIRLRAAQDAAGVPSLPPEAVTALRAGQLVRGTGGPGRRGPGHRAISPR